MKYFGYAGLVLGGVVVGVGVASLTVVGSKVRGFVYGPSSAPLSKVG